MNIVCKNCDTHFKGHYCFNCAQKASTGRLKVKHVLHEFWHNFTHTDKGYLSLVKDMIVKPGVVIRDYINGKRKKYFNPYTFYLVTTAILILVTKQVYHYEDELYDYRNEYGQYINAHYNIMVLCSMPFIALLLQLVFIKKKYNYAEWITFLVFTFGLINFIQVFIQLIYFPFIKYHYQVKNYADYIGYLLIFYVLVKFIKPAKVWEWIQCLIVTVVIYFCIELVASLITLWVYGVPTEKLIKMLKNQF